MRITYSLTAACRALMTTPDAEQYGHDIAARAGVPSGVMYPILARMRKHGWITDHWEDAAIATEQKRPPRRYVRLTELGVRQCREIVTRAEVQRRYGGRGA